MSVSVKKKASRSAYQILLPNTVNVSELEQAFSRSKKPLSFAKLWLEANAFLTKSVHDPGPVETEILRFVKNGYAQDDATARSLLPSRKDRTHAKLRVDSRTTSSGATLRWVAATSRFSSTPLTPSSTMPTADAPIASIG